MAREGQKLSTGNNNNMQDIDLAFISEPDQILDIINQSCLSQTVVGISAPILGNGVFLTSVEKVVQADSDYIVQLKGYDVTGYILERNKIRLSDIRSVCPFKSVFKNPYLKELTGERFYETI
jgi:hypothetical protein